MPCFASFEYQCQSQDFKRLTPVSSSLKRQHGATFYQSGMKLEKDSLPNPPNLEEIASPNMSGISLTEGSVHSDIANKIQEALQSRPQRGKKRDNLSLPERLELTRTRNREHAKSTRIRKKARHQELCDREMEWKKYRTKEMLDTARRRCVAEFVEFRFQRDLHDDIMNYRPRNQEAKFTTTTSDVSSLPVLPDDNETSDSKEIIPIAKLKDSTESINEPIGLPQSPSSMDYNMRNEAQCQHPQEAKSKGQISISASSWKNFVHSDQDFIHMHRELTSGKNKVHRFTLKAC